MATIQVRGYQARLRPTCVAVCTIALFVFAVPAWPQVDDEASAGQEARPTAGEPAAGAQPTTVKAQGRVRLPPAPATATAPAAQQSICDLARAARARNSPAAPGLEAQCAAQPVDLPALAARGEIVASEDPRSAELLRAQPDELARRGFFVGMGAWEGQTAPGPGKDRVRVALAAGERVGFDSAAAFSLARNSNPELLRIGAAIAATDSRIARLRNREPTVLYRMGFDIATGIFGDPAKGARGNTATGPGSMKIRDTLNDEGKRGFDASVKLHLSRDYRTPKPGAAEAAEAAENANAIVLAEVEILISEYRSQYGLGPVTLDPILIRIATAHAIGMAEEDELAYVLPGEGSFKERLAAGNFQGVRADEIILGETQTTVDLRRTLDLWTASPLHNRKLLAPGVSRIGIYVAYSEPASKFRAYWSLMLGEPSAAPEAAAAEVPAPDVLQ